MRAMMTRQMMVMTMEIVVEGSQIKKSNSMISWTKNGVPSHHWQEELDNLMKLYEEGLTQNRG